MFLIHIFTFRNLNKNTKTTKTTANMVDVATNLVPFSSPPPQTKQPTRRSPTVNKFMLPEDTALGTDFTRPVAMTGVVMPDMNMIREMQREEEEKEKKDRKKAEERRKKEEDINGRFVFV